MSDQRKAQAVQRALSQCGATDEATRRALEIVWEDAFEEGRLAALDELQDRFCVCMK